MIALVYSNTNMQNQKQYIKYGAQKLIAAYGYEFFFAGPI